ncbi:hypothetical protein [Nocardia sp. NPDC005978]|uniref:hypothetical protein n=1 Tax=unclassified Nocardia TaxID=2637762 RepID=UPI0033B294D1
MKRTDSLQRVILVVLAAGFAGAVAATPAVAGEPASETRIEAPAVLQRAVSPVRSASATSIPPIASIDRARPVAADAVRPVGPDVRPAASSLLDLLPVQLNCLLSTGWAAFCLGLPLI